MSETARTLAFAGVAAVTAVAAAALSLPGPAPETAGFEQVGTPFFPDLAAAAENALAEDAASAGTVAGIGAFTITAFDEATGEIRDFRVTRDVSTGLYGIAPYGYPAEAAGKLAETAAALAAVTRTALKSRREADWADLGVNDPAGEDVAKLEGRGIRVSLTGADGNELADLIIGEPVEGREGLFHVREPRDDSTYVARLDLDLSARFADWVDPKVLGVTAADLRRLLVPGERADLQAAGLVPAADLLFTRADAAGQWEAADPPEGRRAKQAAVNELARTATGLTITGVRPKPAGLNPDLTIDPAVVRSERQFALIGRDLLTKGFLPLQAADDTGRVVGAAGQLTVSTEAGVAYDLDFGELFTGTEYDFAVGDYGDGYRTLEPDADDAEQGEEADAEAPATRRGRYLFVTARLDEAALGEPPVRPEPPPEIDAADEEDGDDAEPSAKEAYETALAEYAAAKTAFDERQAAAAERVEELNRRFGDWYYVVDAEDVAELKLSPDALLEDMPAEDPLTAPGLDDDGAAGSPMGDLNDLLGGAEPPAAEPAAPPRGPLTAPRPAPRTPSEPPAVDPAPRTPLTAPRPVTRGSSEAPADPADGGEPGEPTDGEDAPGPADGAGDDGAG